MKKVLIAIIVAAVAVVAFYGTEHVVHATTHDNTATVQNSTQATPNNTQTNNSSNNLNNSTTPNNTGNTNNANSNSSATLNKTSNNNNNNNSNSSNNSNNLGDTQSNTQSKTKQNNNATKTQTQTPTSQSVDWAKINATGVLSSETADYFAQQLLTTENKATKSATNGSEDQNQMNISSYKSYEMVANFIKDKISPAIESKLNNSDSSNFDNVISQFNQFTKNSISAIYPLSQGGSELPLLQNSLAIPYENNFGGYLIGAYVNTGVDPLLSSQFMQVYSGKQNATYNKFIGDVTLTQNKSANLAGQMNKNNATDVLDTYNQIYALWNTQIDNVYNYIKANSNGYIGPKNLTQSEKVWINFRDTMINEAGAGLTGTNKEIAQKRMAIRMTQLQTYNLMANLSFSVGQDL